MKLRCCFCGIDYALIAITRAMISKTVMVGAQLQPELTKFNSNSIHN